MRLFSVTNISAESVNDLNASIVDNGIELSTESVALSQVPDNIKNLVSDHKADSVFLVSDPNDKAELYTLRTENSKTGEGTVTVHSVPVKYIDKAGKMQFIDTTMKPLSLAESVRSGFSYRNAANNFTVSFGNTAVKGINFDNAFTFQADSDASEIETGQVQTENGHGKIIYPNVFGSGTKVEYINTENGIKENIILDSYNGQNRFNFIFRSDTHVPILTENGTNILVADKNDPQKIEYRFLSLYAYDSYDPTKETVQSNSDFRHMNEDLYYELTDNGDGVYTITVVVPEEYLTHPEIVYPITIDPSITPYISSNSNAQDTFVDAGNPVSYNGDLDYIRFGVVNGYKNFGYHRFSSLPSLPSGASVTSAHIKFTFRSGQTTPTKASGVRMGVLRVTAHQWHESTITWNNQPYGTSGPMPEIVYNGPYLDYFNADITGMVQAWYSGEYNYGVDFTYNNENYNDVNSVVSSEGEAHRAPVLTINYDFVPTGITLSKSSVTLYVGETTQIVATVSPSNANNKSVTWSSSDTYIASVDASGRITAKTSGTTTIKARTTNGKVATCSVTVKKKGYHRNIEEVRTFVNISNGFPITVAYSIYLTAGVEIDRHTNPTNRRAWEVSAFTKLDRSAFNPVLAAPQLSVGVTDIDGVSVNMIDDDNVLTTPSWLWDRKVGHPYQTVVSSATLTSLAVCWQKDALVPYAHVKLSFTF